MKKVLLFYMLLFCAMSYGQDTASIKGKVLDGELFGEPLMMANISLANTNKATTSNFHGNFSFDNLVPGDYQLLIQFLGYEALELKVNLKKGEQLEVFETLHPKALSLTTAMELPTQQQPVFETKITSQNP